MSKAFTSEETAPDPVLVRPRAPLPPGVPNYVTRRGLSALERELADLERERAAVEGVGDGGAGERPALLVARVAELAARVHGATVVDPPEPGSEEVRFGATVVTRDARGHERRVQILGVDEANGREGKVAFVSPLARALLGRRRGELATLRSPRGEEELEIVEVEYERAD